MITTITTYSSKASYLLHNAKYIVFISPEEDKMNLLVRRKCFCDSDSTPISNGTTAGQAVTDCLLSNSIFTVAFVLLGTYIGVKRKSYRPLAVAAVSGSIADGIYGYYYSCRDLINAYNTARASSTK